MPTLFYHDSLRIEIRPKESGHNVPHVHAIYQGQDVSIDFDGKVIVGSIDRQKQNIACE